MNNNNENKNETKNNKKAVVIGAAVLVALLVIFGIVWFFTKPSTSKGSKAIVIEVTGSTGENTKYDLSTDAEFLTQAMDELSENGSGFSYSGTGSDYGIMVEYINGERAVFAEDNAYWALYVNGEYGQYGADSQPVTDGDDYAWKYELAQ